MQSQHVTNTCPSTLSRQGSSSSRRASPALPLDRYVCYLVSSTERLQRPSASKLLGLFSLVQAQTQNISCCVQRVLHHVVWCVHVSGVPACSISWTTWACRHLPGCHPSCRSATPTSSCTGWWPVVARCCGREIGFGDLWLHNEPLRCCSHTQQQQQPWQHRRQQQQLRRQQFDILPSTPSPPRLHAIMLPWPMTMVVCPCVLQLQL